MSDACRKCAGTGRYWNGQRWITCRPPWGPPHEPGQVHVVPRDEWPAYMARLGKR